MDSPQTSLSEQGFPLKVVVAAVVVVVVAGVGTGFLFARKPSATSSGKPVNVVGAPGVTVTNGAVGINDTSTFRDCATGQLESGGIQGEGTHHLIRPGGASQTAYLTSSVVDLDQFVGKQVEVCGQTIASQKAGWLMDVGLVKLQ